MRDTIENLLILTAVSVWAFAFTVQATDTKTSEARLNLRLLAFVPERDSSLDTMKEKVVTIFSGLGVEVSWIDCIRNGETTGDSQCNAPRRATEIYVRIMPGKASEEDSLDPDALGFAAPSGSLVTLFYRAAEKLSELEPANIGQVLGYATAHELGHIIMGTGAHSSGGVMEACWTKKTATEILCGRLAFSNQQAELLKAHLLSDSARRDRWFER